MSKTKLSSSPPRSIGFAAGSSSSLLRPRNRKSSSPLTNNRSEAVSDAGSTEPNNIICSIGQLRDSVVQIHHCPKYPLTVSENSSGRRGLVSRVTLGCECGWFHHVTDPYNRDHLSVNSRAVLSMRLIGRGPTCLNTFCAGMDLPGGLSHASYKEYNADLFEASKVELRSHQLSCADRLWVMSAGGTLFVPPRIDSENNTGDESNENGGDESRNDTAESNDDNAESDQNDDAESSENDDAESSDSGGIL